MQQRLIATRNSTHMAPLGALKASHSNGVPSSVFARSLIGLLLLAACSTTADAACPAYELKNGDPADATQVMANFNCILNGPTFAGNASFTGSVGIGTTSPATALDIDGVLTLRGKSTVPSASAVNQGTIYFDTTSQTFKVSQNGSAYMALGGSSGSTSPYYTAGNTALNYHTNSVTGIYYELTRSSVDTADTFLSSSAAGVVHVGTGKSGVSLSNGTLIAGGLGIGTTSPSTALDINGAFTLQGTAAPSVSASGQGRIYFDATSNTFQVSQNGGAYTALLSGSSGGTSQWATSGSNIYYASGYVGIGSLSPSYSLDIVSSGMKGIRITDSVEPFILLNNSGSSGASAIRLQDNGANKWDLNGGSATGLFFYDYTRNGASFRIYSNGNMALMEAGGNVGVGTTSPSTALDVSGAFTLRGTSAPAVSAAGQGTIFFDTTSQTFKVSQNGGAYTALVGGGSGGTSQWTTTGSDIYFSTGKVGIGTTSARSVLEITDVSPLLTLNATSSAGLMGLQYSRGTNIFAWDRVLPTSGEFRREIGASAGWGGFQTFYTDGAEKMRITSTGKVGIGTTSPVQALHVVGNIYATGNITCDGTCGGGGGSSLWTTSGSNIYDNTGNVGIGTTSPIAKLDVVTGVGNGTSNEANAFRLRSNAVGGNAMTLQIGVNNTGVGGSNQGYAYLQANYWGGNLTNPILLNPQGGPVGIGHGYASGFFALDVGGNILVRAASATSPGNMGAIGFGTYSAPGYGGSYTEIRGVWDTGSWTGGSGLAFDTGNYNSPNIERMRISSTGNVGIGTSSPSYTLHVNGTAYAAGAAGALSDIRDKRNVAPLSIPALDTIAKLRPVTFFWKAPKDEGMHGRQTGLIAQEVEKVLPSAIMTAKDARKSKAIKYNELTTVLIKAVQEQQREIKLQTEEIRRLQSQNAAIESRLRSVERPRFAGTK